MRSGNDFIIEIENLSFEIDSTVILEKISLSVKKGEFLGIFGPNGGGKTTLLNLLLGFLKPSSGSIEIFGLPPHQARTQIGYVPQITRFDRKFPISVFEVVAMGLLRKLTWYGRFTAQTKKKALDALEKVGLETLAKRPFSTLSGGQAQRVLLARALANDPQLLLLDEPTASVDAEAEADIHKLLMQLKGTVTILMVSHDLQTIASDVDHLLFIQRKANIMTKEQICGHFAMGLYHTPIQGGLPVLDR
jgi:zinc transport system ATP-binding protein